MTIQTVATILSPILAIIAAVLAFFGMRSARQQALNARKRELEYRVKYLKSKMRQNELELQEVLDAARDLFLTYVTLGDEVQTDHLQSAILHLSHRAERSFKLIEQDVKMAEDFTPRRSLRPIELRLQMVNELRNWIAQGKTSEDPEWPDLVERLEALRNSDEFYSLGEDSKEQGSS